MKPLARGRRQDEQVTGTLRGAIPEAQFSRSLIHARPSHAGPDCPVGCTGHAAQCPQRHGGGLVFREIRERRRKVVQLPPELITALKQQRGAQYLEKLDAGSEWCEHDLVFAQPNGKPIDPRDDWEEWSAVLKAVGLPHLGVHAMRHSAATIALDEGIALPVVQDMLGHADIRITRGYTHVGHPLAEDAAQRMERALFGEGT